MPLAASPVPQEDERFVIQKADWPFTQTPESASMYELLDRLREMSLADNEDEPVNDVRGVDTS